MLKCKANLFIETTNADLPITYAAVNGHASTVRLLLASGADTLTTTIFSREQLLDFLKDETHGSQERLKVFMASQAANLERISMTASDIAFVMGYDKILNEILGT